MQKEIEILPLYYDYVLTTQYPVYILVGGRNSGKSFFMEQLIPIKLNNCKDYKMLVVEDVETNIGAGVKDGILERIEEYEHEQYYNSLKQPPEIIHKNTNNNVIFKGYHSEKQQKQVKSLNEVTAVWYEEGENITLEQFKALRMQLRGGKPEDRQLYITMNPINPDSYINETFFQSEPDEVFERFNDGRPKVFIKNISVDIEDRIVNIPCMIVVSTHWDNPYLTDEQRADIEELKYSNLDLYHMLAEGKFIKPGNTHFPEFKPHIHVIEPREIPNDWYTYTTMDYGLDMLAGLKVSFDYHNNMYITAEEHEPDLIISQAAERMKRLAGNDTIQLNYGPPDLMQRQKTSGKTTWDLFGESEWYLSETNNRRDIGALAMKEWLKVFEVKDEDGTIIKKSRLFIFNNCTNLIRCLPKVLTSKSNPNMYAAHSNEIEKNAPANYHDYTHIVDALRYICVMHNAIPIRNQVKRNISNIFFNRPEEETNTLCGDLY